MNPRAGNITQLSKVVLHLSMEDIPPLTHQAGTPESCSQSTELPSFAFTWAGTHSQYSYMDSGKCLSACSSWQSGDGIRFPFPQRAEQSGGSGPSAGWAICRDISALIYFSCYVKVQRQGKELHYYHLLLPSAKALNLDRHWKHRFNMNGRVRRFRSAPLLSQADRKEGFGIRFDSWY